MKRTWAGIYALICALLMVAGCVLVFIFAWRLDTPTVAHAVVGMALGFVFSTIIHELGHVICGLGANMQIVYSKFFCFKLVREGKRLKFGFASPFAPEETQVVPKSGGDMMRRVIQYTTGGLLYSAFFLLAVLVSAFVLPNKFIYWGMLPYTAYICLLNIFPVEYAAGKTDALVYRGLRRGEPAEQAMLAAMEIQGRLYEGKSYAEIDESLYLSAPQLPEDEPLFAVMLDLKYRYYLERNEIEKAADCLNRLVVSQEYLSPYEREKLAGECVYMHALNGDYERADECGKLCGTYLKEGTASAKRILAAFSSAFGKQDAVSILKEQAEQALEKEFIAGNAAFERILLSRISDA